MSTLQHKERSVNNPRVASMRAIATAANRRRKRRVDRACASLNRDNFTDDFDLRAELADDPYSYAGDELIDIRGVPSYVRTAFRRWQAWAEEGGEQISAGAALACAARFGLHVIESSPQAERWKEASGRAKVLADTSARAQLKLDRELHGVRFELDDPFNAGRCRWAFRCAETQKKELFGAADRVFGVAGGSLVLVCVLEGLRRQPAVHPELASQMATGVEQFLRELDQRAKDVEVLCNVFAGEAG